MEDKIITGCEQVPEEININEEQKYDTLILYNRGCLNIGGLPDPGVTELTIQINKLQVKKEEGGGTYDLKFTTPRDRHMSITVQIEELEGDLHTLSYAPDGWQGKSGSDGGEGADSAFGMGAKGGDGSDGEDGKDGSDCPDVRIRYSSSCKGEVIHNVIRSKGGVGGKGGAGGIGGLSSDGKSRGASGGTGRDGRCGRSGGGGSIMIERRI